LVNLHSLSDVSSISIKLFHYQGIQLQEALQETEQKAEGRENI